MSFRSRGVALLSEFLNGSSFVTELGFFMCNIIVISSQNTISLNTQVLTISAGDDWNAGNSVLNSEGNDDWSSFPDRKSVV